MSVVGWFVFQFLTDMPNLVVVVKGIIHEPRDDLEPSWTISHFKNRHSWNVGAEKATDVFPTACSPRNTSLYWAKATLGDAWQMF